MSATRKFFAVSFIAIYLCYLSWGIAAHTLKLGSNIGPLNYFVVWDMFCGWSAWDMRTHIIAQGASGQYYDVKEPWGAFTPFGSQPRIQYDSTGDLMSSHIRNILRHTDHEPIDRVYVVEEVWPKQYNLPPNLYAQYFERPNDRISYFHLRGVATENGEALAAFPSWHDQQSIASFYENPRLKRQARQGTQMFSTLFQPNKPSVGLTTN